MGCPLVLVDHATNISSVAGLLLASIDRICHEGCKPRSPIWGTGLCVPFSYGGG